MGVNDRLRVKCGMANTKAPRNAIAAGQCNEKVFWLCQVLKISLGSSAVAVTVAAYKLNKISRYEYRVNALHLPA
jgi:hypothetical protein